MRLKRSLRYSFFLFAAALITSLGACKTEARCGKCGMKLEADNPFEAKIESAGAVKRFDAPRCAFEAVGANAENLSSLRVQEFYDRTWTPASQLSFVKGSDVLGPMGPDFVPVAKAHVAKFIHDHGGEALEASAVKP
jgi:copper chaperone NosL